MPHRDPEMRLAYLVQYKKRPSAKEMSRLYSIVTHANQRAKRFGVVGHIRTDDVRAVLAIGACHYCGAASDLGIDHVVPFVKGGPNTPANLVASCARCNKRKHAKASVDAWSSAHDRCVECHTSSKRHVANGLCTTCISRKRRDGERLMAEIKQTAAKAS